MNDSKPTPKNPSRRWTMVGIGAALAGVLTLSACGGPGWHHGRHGQMGDMSPEEAGQRIDKAVKWVLDDVTATPEQKQKIAQIAKDAARDLLPLRTQHRAARGRGVDLFSQATIDRAAIEQLRVEELQLGETASKRFAQALADAAEVLTPDQRIKLAARWKKRMG